MTRALFIFLFSGLLASFLVLAPRAATAGDYYNGGYYSHYGQSYNSTCCYRRVVRYERLYRDYHRPYYRGAYYDSPYYGNGHGYDYSARYAYGQPRRYYAGGCDSRRYRVYDDHGGWGWGSRGGCY